ncbi:MAG: aminopeptidase P family N-terminal domain-containing protein, partial [Actinomycetota bacterium]
MSADLVPMDRAARLERLRGALDAADCPSLLVTKPQNIRWLTGFTGSAGTVLVTPEALTVVTDDRYQVQVGQQLSAAGVTADVVI